MTWPTAAEVRTTLTSAGYLAPITDDLIDEAVVDAIDRWEAQTTWRPFVGTGTAVARDFLIEPRQSLLFLDAPLRTSTAPTLEINGEALSTSLTAWWLPRNAEIAGRPYTALEMRASNSRTYLPAGLLAITGLWGWCASDGVPALARAAVMAGACYDLGSRQTAWRAVAPDGEEGDDGSPIIAPLTRVKEGDVDKEFASTQTERMAALDYWKRTWEKGIRAFRPVRVC